MTWGSSPLPGTGGEGSCLWAGGSQTKTRRVPPVSCAPTSLRWPRPAVTVPQHLSSSHSVGSQLDCVGFHESQPLSAAQLSSVGRQGCAQLTSAQGPPTVGSLPKGASHLGSAGFGDMHSKNAMVRKRGISGAQLAFPERYPGEPVSRIGLSFGERAWAGAGGTPPKQACTEVGGAETLSWPLGRQLWPKAQRGGAEVSSHQLGVPAWPSLWTQCPGLLHSLAG